MKDLVIGLLIGGVYGFMAYIFYLLRQPVEVTLMPETDDDEYAGNIWVDDDE